MHLERVARWDEKGSLLTFVVISRPLYQILHLTCTEIDNVEESFARADDERELLRVEEGQGLEPVLGIVASVRVGN